MNTLPFEQLEGAYEALAEAIDRAGAQQEALFLAKLALSLAHRLGDLERFRQSIDMALQDLPRGSGPCEKPQDRI